MIKHLLFDLDGTLLPIDLDFFMTHYIHALATHFPSIPGKEFSDHLMASTMVMVKSLDPGLTNEEVFWADFTKRVGVSRTKLEPIFQNFYDQDFPKLKKHLTPTDTPRLVLDYAVREGLSVTLATNPIFPLQAIKERLAWINCHEIPFKLITALEDMHFCKPSREYYQEILDRLGLNPQECMMVGNDMEEDLVASYLGMKTCLITDHLISRGKIQVEPDYQCSLEELPVIIKEISSK
jgi:FMN phosphatase YigB (HAD superfamily)